MGETILLILVGAIVGGGLGIAGTLLGYRLNERYWRRRQEETEEEQARAIRTLLSVEIEQNMMSGRPPIAPTPAGRATPSARQASSSRT